MKFNHTAHKELWGWLAENGNRSKHKWSGWKANGGKHEYVPHHCFACDYVLRLTLEEVNCNESCIAECPLQWPGNITCMDDEEVNYFDLWANANGGKEAEKYATLIRDLPLKEEIETE